MAFQDPDPFKKPLVLSLLMREVAAAKTDGNEQQVWVDMAGWRSRAEPWNGPDNIGAKKQTEHPRKENYNK